MTHRAARLLAWSLCAPTFATAGAPLDLVVAGWPLPSPEGAFGSKGMTGLLAVAFATAGALIAMRQLAALQNTAKYADENRAIVSLDELDGWLPFEVSDDGHGFDPRTVRRGAGLRGMADRIEAIGGALEIQSAPGRGTTVTGAVPIAGSR